MLQALRHNDKTVGLVAETDDVIFFFGTRHADKDFLPRIFPHLKFCFLKQVHGADIVTADSENVLTADGHVSQERGLALVIQTADCLPILFGSPKKVLAVHAGWRGLAGGILRAAGKLGSFSHVFIGPHIQAQSFEVGLDVAEKLQALTRANVTVAHADAKKKYIDLKQIANEQIAAAFDCPVEISAENTFTSELFHSFRRGKEKAARQYSFVALK